jgi:hypothetical protein
MFRIRGLRSEVHELQFSSDGRFLFASVDNPGRKANDYDRVPVVQIWKRTSPTSLVEQAAVSSIGAWSSRFVCSSDSRFVGVCTKTGYDFCECETGKVLRSCQALPGMVRAMSPSGRILACTDDDARTASLVELASGKTTCKLDCNPRYLVRPRFAFSPDGRTVASDLNSETILLWDVFTGKQIGKLDGHRGHIVSLAFSPDGRFLVSGSSDTTALVWDYRSRLAPLPAITAELPAQRLEQLWLDLEDEDAARGYRAVSALVQSPEAAVALLRQKLSPATAEEQRRLQPWIDDLGKETVAVRQRASAELGKIGALAEPAIREALRGELPLESRRRLEAVLGSPSTPPAPRWLATQRSLETLELIGTPEARRLLLELSEGLPESSRTQDARRSLDRLDRRLAAAKN